MPPANLRAELVTPSKSEAAEMPTLRGFDEEFGQAAGVTQLDRTRSILLAVALGAAILGGLTLAWLARRPCGQLVKCSDDEFTFSMLVPNVTWTLPSQGSANNVPARS